MLFKLDRSAVNAEKLGSQELQIITPDQAKSILDERVTVIGGMSFILYDTSQFMPVSFLPHLNGGIILTTTSITTTGGESSFLGQFEYTRLSRLYQV